MTEPEGGLAATVRVVPRVVRLFRTAWHTAISLVFVSLLGGGAYWWGRAQITEEAYQRRLGLLKEEYAMLRRTYNEAVRHTAVTELDVHEGRLAVVIRTVEGELQRIETPFDPAAEIYVDYVVLDGRLWIRRVFDQRTPPEKGVLIDPGLSSVDWSAAGAAHGKAVYRSLAAGRWVITVSGDGALVLNPKASAPAGSLTARPTIRDFEEITADIEQGADDELRVVEVLKALPSLFRR